MKYRKKPVVIEARQVGNDYDEDLSILTWCGGEVVSPSEEGEDRLLFRIATLEGAMDVIPGDFVIKGVQGEFYPCKPGIFAATYEEVTE